MNDQQPPTIRSDDLLRHLQDLRTGTYEGVQSRGAKEELYRRGIKLLTPVATTMLEEANRLFLHGTGHIEVIGPRDDGSGGLETRFELSWPEQPTVHTVRANHSNQSASSLTTLRTFSIHISLELQRATGRSKLPAGSTPSVKGVSLLPSSN